MVLGRITHYAFDAVLLSAFLAGIKRSTGLTLTSTHLSPPLPRTTGRGGAAGILPRRYGTHVSGSFCILRFPTPSSDTSPFRYGKHNKNYAHAVSRLPTIPPTRGGPAPRSLATPYHTATATATATAHPSRSVSLGQVGSLDEHHFSQPQPQFPKDIG
ncbi:conserved hypothetical protein [Histoplasma capsulatum H143]|uniref:DUF1748 domain-containing protein n=1 Tax=Ajellomyces capsulatus (strain H143) TaxID=544712 RepID=C6H8L7_AJECH|nr:conserved hypothetical protein [Histoplasma capsulatum H143]